MYEIELSKLIEEVEESILKKESKRVRIIIGNINDFGERLALDRFEGELIGKKIPYYFPKNGSIKNEGDYEINLDERRIVC